MNEKMINYVVEHGNTTKDQFLSLNWEEQVDFILLHLAGGPNRWCIYKDFMNFMAEFCQECIDEDKKAGTNLSKWLFTVAMQRLSKGAVLHKPVSFRNQLEGKYWIYSSAYDDYHIMTEDCLNFIYFGLPVAAKYAPTKDYALTIAWGLLEHLDEDGNTTNGFSLDCPNPNDEGQRLFSTAHHIVMNAGLSDEEIFEHFAEPDQWRKHIDWLWRHLDEKRWKQFFEKQGIPSSGLKGWKARKTLKKEMKEKYYAISF